MSNIIRHIQDEIEFFTDTTTGQSGISVSGLALLCGVSHQAISKLTDNLATKSPSKWLEPLVGKDLNLATKIGKRGGEVRAIRAEVCAHIIQHYAFQGVEVAQYSLTKFAAIGIDTWIQGITQPQQRQLSAKSQQRIQAREYLLEALQQFQQQTDFNTTYAYREFAYYYNKGYIKVPGWVREVRPSCSYASLHNWQHRTNEAYGKRKGQTKIAQNPELKRFLEAKVTANPTISNQELYRQAQSRFADTPSADSIRRWRKI